MSVELIKANSAGLKGSLPIQLVDGTPKVNEEGKQILKFHGIYQQTNRDVKGRKNKQYSFMLRTRLPGGQLTAEQYLLHDALADEFGQGDLRLTTRQTIQLHGIIKGDLRPTLQRLNQGLITTIAACGDVVRNVMMCPAPFGDPIRQQLQEVANQISDHLTPRTTAYHEVWLIDEEGKKSKQNLDDTPPAEEPIYGKTYLPRKFKIAMAYPGDNCTDIFTNDIGLVGLLDESGETVHGFNVYVGGGMGRTHNKQATFPLLAKPLGYVPVDQMIDVVEKIVLVQRDYGDRENRRHARMKYLINDWGIEKFKATVIEYLGYDVAEVRPMPEMSFDDHLGWHQQADGNWFYGIYVENGRVKDDGIRRIRTGLTTIISQFKPSIHLTGQQNILLGGIPTEQKAEIDQLVRRYGLYSFDELTHTRRLAMACPALPTCGLAITESERVLPKLVDRVELIVAELGLTDEEISIRMTGCPNGCARPYVADIGLVGRSGSKYNLSLGGNPEGTRLNEIYKELVEFDDLHLEIRQILLAYKAHRLPQERFGDWVARLTVKAVRALSESEAYRWTQPDPVGEAEAKVSVEPVKTALGYQQLSQLVGEQNNTEQS